MVITYKIVLVLRDGSKVTYPLQAQLSDVPLPPPEKEDNLNISIGNNLLAPEKFAIVPSMKPALLTEISKAPAKKSLHKAAKKKTKRKSRKRNFLKRGK